MSREQLWEVLRDELGVSEDVMGGLAEVYRGACASLCVGGERGAPFPMDGGVRQGDPLSPLLFCLLLDRVSAYLAEHAPSYTRARCPLLPALLATSLLLYADDIVLLSGGPTRLQTLLDALGTFSTAHYMSVSAEKSKVIVHGC